MNNIDFISLYHSYINKYSKNINLIQKNKINNSEKPKILNILSKLKPLL